MGRRTGCGADLYSGGRGGVRARGGDVEIRGEWSFVRWIGDGRVALRGQIGDVAGMEADPREVVVRV